MNIHLPLRSMLVALLLCGSACAAAADGVVSERAAAAPVAEPMADALRAEPVSEPPPAARIALQSDASVAPDEIDGYCEDGVGVYLSADDESAQLVLYVVAPAETAVFWHPSLRLTVQDGEKQAIEAAEYDTFELKAGESRVFTLRADGRRLMHAAAEVSADSDAQATLPELAQARPTLL